MSTKWILTFVCVLLFNSFILSQVIQFGRCGDVRTVEYFEIDRFLGKWYEIQRFPAWYEASGQCAYKILNYCRRKVKIEHGFVRDDIHYVLHVNSSYYPGDEAIFIIEPNNIDPMGIPMTVLATNYEEFAVIYGCAEDKDLNLKYLSAWILSREKTLHPDLLERAQAAIDNQQSASSSYFEDVKQDGDCQHYWTAHVEAEPLSDM